MRGTKRKTRNERSLAFSSSSQNSLCVLITRCYEQSFHWGIRLAGRLKQPCSFSRMPEYRRSSVGYILAASKYQLNCNYPIPIYHLFTGGFRSACIARRSGEANDDSVFLLLRLPIIFSTLVPHDPTGGGTAIDAMNRGAFRVKREHHLG